MRYAGRKSYIIDKSRTGGGTIVSTATAVKNAGNFSEGFVTAIQNEWEPANTGGPPPPERPVGILQRAFSIHMYYLVFPIYVSGCTSIKLNGLPDTFNNFLIFRTVIQFNNRE